MTPDEFAALADAVGMTKNVLNLHPGKLTQWHQALFGLPDALFVQQGCGPLFEQLRAAVQAISRVSTVLGQDLQVSHRELATRQVGSWPLLVSSLGEPRGFLIRWDSKASRWTVRASDALQLQRIVPDLEVGVRIALAWSEELDAKMAETEAALEPGA